MSAAAAAAIIGGSTLIGGSRANSQNLKIARETNAMRVAEAKKNRDFQERMSSTAYQRAMDDMAQAGLNPILAYKQGGASTPGGSQANLVNPQYTDPVGPAAASATDAYSKTMSANQLRKQTEINRLVSHAQRIKMMADATNAQETAKRNQMQTKLLEKDLQRAGVEADFYKDYGKEWYYWNKAMQTFQSTVNSAGDAIDLFKPWRGKNMHKLKRNQSIFNDKTGEIIKEYQKWNR